MNNKELERMEELSIKVLQDIATDNELIEYKTLLTSWNSTKALDSLLLYHSDISIN